MPEFSLPALLGCGFVLLSASCAFCADAVGFRDTQLDKQGARPLHLVLWYPTRDQEKTVIIGENRAFHGFSAIKEAAPDSEAHPLILLSHGYGGNWRNLSWLGNELAHKGYIVAAPDHPGTTTLDRNAVQAERLWERPHDLSRAIDALMAAPQLAGKVDQQRIAVIGHSLGGWTATALAGARFDTARFAKDCRKNTGLRACNLSAGLGLANRELEKDMSDPRIRAFISLDLGLARGFSPESLANIDVPSLLIGAGTDIGDMPARLESGYLAQYLPKTTSTYVEIPGAMHFSFMQLCKPDAAALLEEDRPGDGIVCKDGGRERADIHREISFLVTGFLARVFALRP